MYSNEVYAVTQDDLSNHIEDSPLLDIIDNVFDKYRESLTHEQKLIASQNYSENTTYGVITAFVYYGKNFLTRPKKNGGKKEKRPNKKPRTNGHAGNSKTTGKKTRVR